MPRKAEDPVARFWSKVDQSGDCWLWNGVLTSSGYGQFWLDGRMVPAHRFSYESIVGPIPAGLVIDHLCRVRDCVNPAHLEPVTGRENTLRGETPARDNAAKTHCAKGHPFDEANTYERPRGGRDCRACRIISNTRYRHRNGVTPRRFRTRKQVTA